MSDPLSGSRPFVRSPRPIRHRGLEHLAVVAVEVRADGLQQSIERHRSRAGDHARAGATARYFEEWFGSNGFACPLPRQIEDAARHGLPRISAAVDALLLCEVGTGVLMGVQDLEKVRGPLCFDHAADGETFRGIRSQIVCGAGEPVLRDDDGIVASVFQGPDRRTRVDRRSTRLQFVVFDAPGLDAESFERGVAAVTGLLTDAGASPVVARVSLGG